VRPESLDSPVDPEDLRISRTYTKLHSACALSHSALDTVLVLGPLPAPEEVEGVAVSEEMKH
jgi:2-methylcitrate dehydratase PrpD